MVDILSHHVTLLGEKALSPIEVRPLGGEHRGVKFYVRWVAVSGDAEAQSTEPPGTDPYA
jgi:hypothetical protein